MNGRCPICVITQHGCRATFFSILPVFFCFFFKNQNTVVGKQNGKNNRSEPSVKLKLLRLPHMVKTALEPTLLPQNFKSSNGNQIPP